MGWEGLSAAFVAVAAVAAIVGVVVAVRANRRADAANQIAARANRLAEEANVTACKALALERQRDRVAERPNLSVRLGAGVDGPWPAFDVMVWHDGTEPLDVQLQMAQPEIATFLSANRPSDLAGSSLPQDEQRDLGRIAVGERRRLSILWLDPDQRSTAILSEVKNGEDRWELRYELDLDDQARFN